MITPAAGIIRSLGGLGAHRFAPSNRGPSIADFTGANGDMPAGWTRQWDAGTRWGIESNILKYTPAVNNFHFAAMWTGIGTFKDVEVLALLNSPTSLYEGTFHDNSIILRGTIGFGDGNKSGYLVGPMSSNPLRIAKIVSNTSTNLHAGVAQEAATGVDFWIRTRIVGNVLSARLWLASGNEPTGWEISVVDNTFANAGYVGMQAISDNYARYVKSFTVTPL